MSLQAPDLTTAQQRILNADVRVVEAGPGSGKTRALVARFIQEAGRPGAGVGLISFTNAAVDEVRHRASGHPNLLRAPNFVGTIDSFLHRFVVTPNLVPTLGGRPTYVATWRDLPDNLRRPVILQQVPGPGIGLEKFVPTGVPGSFALAHQALNRNEHHYLTGLTEAQRAAIVALAAKRITAYNRAGIYDASTARALAYANLKGGIGPRIVERLAIRFGLLLVDEAQDCDAPEMGALRLLAVKIPTVLVADPDQAIFEFRGGDPALFRKYWDEQDEGHRIRLAENHRSTRAICRAITALRAASNTTVESVDSGDCPPVLVLEGTQGQLGEQFAKALAKFAIARDDAIVLAHQRSVAASVAGRKGPKATAATGNRLAGICFALRGAQSGPSERRAAIVDAERILLSLIVWPVDAAVTDRQQQLALLERSPEWLRMASATVIARLAAVDDAKAFGEAARQVIKEVLSPLPQQTVTLGDRVKRPDADVWKHCTAPPKADTFRYGTIHAHKGGEFGAVLVPLFSLQKTEGRDVLGEIADGVNSEGRRVLYVGASRARRLLVFGGTKDNANRVQAILQGAGVPVERC